MPRPLLSCALVALAIVLTPAAAHADPHTEHLDALVVELSTRLIHDFGGDLDKPAKKQLKAVQKSLAFIAKESDSASDDLKALSKSAKKLSKAYPSEFDPMSGDQTLSGLLFGAALGLRNDAVEQHLDSTYAAPTLSPSSLVGKVTKLNEKAGDLLLDSIDSNDLFERLKIIAKAVKFLEKAASTIAKDQGEGVYFVYGTVGGSPIITQNHFAETHSGELQIFGQFTNPNSGSVASVAITVEGVSGPGTYEFVGDGWSGYYESGFFNPTRYDIVPGSGALIVETYDLAGSVIAGTFSFDGFNKGNGITLKFAKGDFRLTTIYQ